MKTKAFCLFVVFSAALILFSGCGRMQKPVVLETQPHNVVDMKLSNYKFTPNFLQTYQGYTIVFRFHNGTNDTHNFTLKNPGGNVIQDVDVPPGKSAEVKVVFSTPGAYKFHCNKGLHSEMGMTGQVMVLPK